MTDIEKGFSSSSDERNNLLEPDSEETETIHKTTIFFSLFFKILSIFMYLLADSISNSFVMGFVWCILFLSFDFWIIKNISGRLLVGLRWWNEVQEDGTSHWVFESKENHKIHPTDSLVFWGSLYLTPCIWILFFITVVFTFSFKWLLIVIIAFILNGANLVGYWKCQKDSKQKFTEAKKKIVTFVAGRLVES